MEDIQESYYSVKQIKDQATGKRLREIFFDAHGGQDITNVHKIVDYDLATDNPIEERYFKDGILHREDAPAKVIRDPKSGMISEEFWYQSGVLHRDKYGAYIKFNLDPEHRIGLGEEYHVIHYEYGVKLFDNVYD